MRVLISGATGLIGKEIVAFCLKNNIEVNYLTTHRAKLSSKQNYCGFYWKPNSKYIDKNCFKGVDAIIHLAGATISKDWTPEYKDEIINSRIASTNLLYDILNRTEHSVQQIISASAIGVYPDSLDKHYDETFDTVSSSFLGEVVKVWEEHVDAFSELNIRVCKIRIGLVLSNKGGALQEMTKPIKFGVGAAFGTGKQWQSWIHISDLANVFLYVLQKRLEGVYNGVAPNPVTNTELTKTIAKTLKRPLFMPNISKSLMKLILGDMHILLFESQRVSSKKIESQGFSFKYPNLQSALKDLL